MIFFSKRIAFYQKIQFKKKIIIKSEQIHKNLHCAVANSANPATSKSSIMAAKTLQNHTKAAAAASAASSGIYLP